VLYTLSVGGSAPVGGDTHAFVAAQQYGCLGTAESFEFGENSGSEGVEVLRRAVAGIAQDVCAACGDDQVPDGGFLSEAADGRVACAVGDGELESGLDGEAEHLRLNGEAQVEDVGSHEASEPATRRALADAQFAVESIRRKWNGAGRAVCPTVGRLLITADAGGSNGDR
jgi:hypothetical protein